VQDGAKVGSAAWEREFDCWLAPFWTALGDTRRRRWGPVYVRGLLGPGERNSVEPLVARVAPADYEQVHHFVSTSCWDPAPLERVLAEKAQALVGGPDAVLIIDDTALLKQGKRSVGVARQYAGAAGKTTNCQTLVSLTLARDEVPVGLALRLFLPTPWTDDPERCQAVGVPEERLAYRTKLEIALAELDRLQPAGVTWGCVLADAGYGISAAFRQALSARRLTWAVGIPRIQKVYPLDVATQMPVPEPGARRGRPRRHPVPSVASTPAEQVLAAARWRRLTWRTGTKGPLSARFAAVRIVVADGTQNAGGQHLPGEAAWLVGERRDTGERKYYLTNHPPRTPLRALAAAIKARWSCDQAHQQLKEELGLDHFEERTWLGLHHHALITLISFAFLQHLRLEEIRRRGENAAALRRPPAAVAAGDPARPARARTRRPPPLPHMQRTADVSAARVNVSVASWSGLHLTVRRTRSGGSSRGHRSW
jgi:SRSO17 transposase